jgi:hypothetical protein
LKMARRNVQNVHKSTLDIGGTANLRAFRSTFVLPAKRLA